MPFSNDAFGYNMFTLAIEMEIPKITLGVMKNLCSMPPEDFKPIAEKIPIDDVMSRDNACVEPLFRNAMVPAISDRGFDPPVVFNQSENTVVYANSP